MFSLKVTEDEIQGILESLQGYIYPNFMSRNYLTMMVYGCPTDIAQRKTRLCIAELRKRGVLIIAKRGYSLAGDDSEPVIHFINGMYSRAHSLTMDADIMFHCLKQKYGDAVTKNVVVPDGQPFLGMVFHQAKLSDIVEPPYRKSIDARGNEIALQFEADA